MELNESLKNLVFSKSALKQEVYQATKESFELFRSTTKEIIDLFKQAQRESGQNVRFEFADRGDFEFEVKFGGDDRTVEVVIQHTQFSLALDEVMLFAVHEHATYHIT